MQLLLYAFVFSLKHLSIFSLRHFSHLSCSSIITRHNIIHWSIISDIVAKLTLAYFFLKSFKKFGLWLKLKNTSLYASLLVQTCDILTVLTYESARVGDFSPHVTFAVGWHRIYDFTVAMIKLLLLLTCVCHKNSMPSTLI